MKIGLLAYSIPTGLGYQTKRFAEHMNPAKTLVVDISEINKIPLVEFNYYQAKFTSGFPTDEECEWLVDGMDIVFVCENPLNYHLYEYARRKNVKVIQQFNPEFLEYFRKPFYPHPTILANPSLWMIDKVKDLRIAEVIHLPVPVDLPQNFRKIEKVKTLFHVGGKPAVNDRNGTLTYLRLIQILGDEYNYKLYYQTPLEAHNLQYFIPVIQEIEKCKKLLGNRFEVIKDVENNEDMYQDGDIMILPRKYGGLCLPMWEALSRGVPVIMPNICPNNTILPDTWLNEASIAGSFNTQTNILLYESSIPDICYKIKHIESMIDKYNIEARKIATEMSWPKQIQNYNTLFQLTMNT